MESSKGVHQGVFGLVLYMASLGGFFGGSLKWFFMVVLQGNVWWGLLVGS